MEDDNQQKARTQFRIFEIRIETATSKTSPVSKRYARTFYPQRCVCISLAEDSCPSATHFCSSLCSLYQPHRHRSQSNYRHHGIHLNCPWKSCTTSFQGPTSDKIRETAAVENASIFWPFLDSLTTPELVKYDVEKDYYERVVKLLHDEFFTDPVTLGSFELGLSLHTAAPKIEAYYQYYRTSVVSSLDKYDESCDNWVHWRGEQICSPDNLEATLKGSTNGPRYKEG
jgi:Thioredoxin-like domain